MAAKPYSLGGFVAFTPTVFGLDRDAALYRLRFFDQDVSNPLTQYDLGLRPEVSYRLGIFALRPGRYPRAARLPGLGRRGPAV